MFGDLDEDGWGTAAECSHGWISGRTESEGQGGVRQGHCEVQGWIWRAATEGTTSCEGASQKEVSS